MENDNLLVPNLQNNDEETSAIIDGKIISIFSWCWVELKWDTLIPISDG